MLTGMTDRMRHRGPDDEGALLFDGAKIRGFAGPDTPNEIAAELTMRSESGGALCALGHRRLSILDLSVAGHQPMAADGQRSWLTYNGEIYNFEELRAELKGLGHHFNSSGDSAVLLAAWRQWGEACLDRLNGMFAFVILDTDRRVLFAARDRFGVKPLYVWRSSEGVLAIASEIKAFIGLPAWRPGLAAQSAYDFLNWGLTDHHRYTLFEGVEQICGGECFALDLDAPLPATLPVRRWYVLQGDGAASDMDFATAADRFRDLFADAVALRLRADVPVGTALSGGLDSSSIVCEMAGQIRTQGRDTALQHSFSACAEDPRYDERPHIEAVVAHAGVANHRIFPRLEDLWARFDDLVYLQDEPFGSTSIFAQWSVFGLARKHAVTVTLDGQGADEYLCGYHGFFGALLSNHLRSGRLRAAWKEAAALRRRHGYRPLRQLALTADAALPDRLAAVARAFVGSAHLEPGWIAARIRGGRPQDPIRASGGRGPDVPTMSRSQLLNSSLPMLLRWCDRSSMAHGVEARTPFLDYRLVEFAFGAPDFMKIGNGETKRLLRRGLAGVLPDQIRCRQDKMGFVTPEEDWVRRRDPAGFRRRVEQAIEQSGGVLTEDARSVAKDLIGGKGPFRFTLFRMIAFGAWMNAFNVKL